MLLPDSPQASETIVLPAADLLQAFFQELGDRVLTPHDVKEVLAQVVCVLLSDDEKTEEGVRRLPEPERLIYFNRIDEQLAEAYEKPTALTGLLQRVDKAVELQVFQRAVYGLARDLRNRLHEYGAYRDAEFPYFFDSLLGYDLVLRYLPN